MFNKSGKKFLRKKSDLIHDYFLCATFGGLIVYGLYRYNNYWNPEDASEELPSNLIFL